MTSIADEALIGEGDGSDPIADATEKDVPPVNKEVKFSPEEKPSWFENAFDGDGIFERLGQVMLCTIDAEIWEKDACSLSSATNGNTTEDSEWSCEESMTTDGTYSEYSDCSSYSGSDDDDEDMLFEDDMDILDDTEPEGPELVEMDLFDEKERTQQLEPIKEVESSLFGENEPEELPELVEEVETSFFEGKQPELSEEFEAHFFDEKPSELVKEVETNLSKEKPPELVEEVEISLFDEKPPELDDEVRASLFYEKQPELVEEDEVCSFGEKSPELVDGDKTNLFDEKPPERVKQEDEKLTEQPKKLFKDVVTVLFVEENPMDSPKPVNEVEMNLFDGKSQEKLAEPFNEVQPKKPSESVADVGIDFVEEKKTEEPPELTRDADYFNEEDRSEVPVLLEEDGVDGSKIIVTESVSIADTDTLFSFESDVPNWTMEIEVVGQPMDAEKDASEKKEEPAKRRTDKIEKETTKAIKEEPGKDTEKTTTEVLELLKETKELLDEVRARQSEVFTPTEPQAITPVRTVAPVPVVTREEKEKLEATQSEVNTPNKPQAVAPGIEECPVPVVTNEANGKQEARSQEAITPTKLQAIAPVNNVAPVAVIGKEEKEKQHERKTQAITSAKPQNDSRIKTEEEKKQKVRKVKAVAPAKPEAKARARTAKEEKGKQKITKPKGVNPAKPQASNRVRTVAPVPIVTKEEKEMRDDLFENASSVVSFYTEGSPEPEEMVDVSQLTYKELLLHKAKMASKFYLIGKCDLSEDMLSVLSEEAKDAKAEKYPVSNKTRSPDMDPQMAEAWRVAEELRQAEETCIAVEKRLAEEFPGFVLENEESPEAQRITPNEFARRSKEISELEEEIGLSSQARVSKKKNASKKKNGTKVAPKNKEVKTRKQRQTKTSAQEQRDRLSVKAKAYADKKREEKALQKRKVEKTSRTKKPSKRSVEVRSVSGIEKVRSNDTTSTWSTETTDSRVSSQDSTERPEKDKETTLEAPAPAISANESPKSKSKTKPGWLESTAASRSQRMNKAKTLSSASQARHRSRKSAKTNKARDPGDTSAKSTTTKSNVSVKSRIQRLVRLKSGKGNFERLVEV